MTELDKNKRNNAILAYMGGVNTLRSTHYTADVMSHADFIKLTPEHLRYNMSWDWMIPVWAKVRHQLTPTMIITAISCIDEADLEKLWILISQVCITWCNQNNIKLD